MYVGSTFDFHPGIHGGILESFAQRFEVRTAAPTVRCYCPDPGAFHLVDYFFYTRVSEFPPQAGFIYSAFYAVTNETPWIADMDDICLPVYHHNALYPGVARLFRDQASGWDAASLTSGNSMLRDALLSRIGAYATPHCRGILFHSQNALRRARGLFTKLGLDETLEARAFLGKAIAVYPSLKPRPERSSEREGRQPTILFMAGDFEEKGGDIALHVFARLQGRPVPPRLVYVGPIPPEARVAHRQTLSRITYSEIVPRRDALELMAASDVLLAPTRYESFGFVFLEAMAHGCVPITYWGDGFEVTREIIDDERTGYVLRQPTGPADVEAEAERFYEKILELIDNSSSLRAMQAAALAEVAEGRFSVEKRNELVRGLLRKPPDSAAVDLRYRRHRAIDFEARDFEEMVHEYREAHKVPRTLRI